MIVTFNWDDLIILIVYMRDQVANFKCGMDLMWYEWEGGLIIERVNFEGWSEIIEEQKSYI